MVAGIILPDATPIPAEPLTPRRLPLRSGPRRTHPSGSAKTASTALSRGGSPVSPAKDAFHRQRPRRAFHLPTALAVFRWSDTLSRRAPGLFPRIPQLGGFDPDGSHRSELPPPNAPPADFCSTTRPADTSADFGLRAPERAQTAGIRRSPLADCHRPGELPEQPWPPNRRHRTPFVIRPYPARLGRPHDAPTGPRPRFHRPPRRGAPSDETRCLSPQPLRATKLSLGADLHRNRFRSPLWPGLRAGCCQPPLRRRLCYPLSTATLMGTRFEWARPTRVTVPWYRPSPCRPQRPDGFYDREVPRTHRSASFRGRVYVTTTVIANV